MHPPTFCTRRLIGIAVGACVAALAPATALAAARIPACTRRGRDERAEVHDSRARRLARHPRQRSGRKHLLRPRAHQSVGPCVHPPRLSGCLAVNLGGHQLGQRGLVGQRPQAAGGHDRQRRHGGRSAADRRRGQLPERCLPPDDRRGPAVYPPNQTASKVVPYPFLACSRPGPVYLSVQAVR